MASEQDFVSAKSSLLNENNANANIVGAAESAAAADASDAFIDGEQQIDPGLLSHIIQEIFYSPMNLCLLGIILFLIYKIVRDRTEVPGASTIVEDEPELPKLRRDFTIKELRAYDGTQEDGRVLVAVNGTVYDVTKGSRFYGPGGPYASFAGRDASRNLATFSVAPNDNDEYDDLSDLTAMEMDSVIEWELQFKEKYQLVGRLLRENEAPNNYDEEEEEEEQDDNAKESTTTDVKNVDSTVTLGSSSDSVTAQAPEGLRKRQVHDTKAKHSDVESEDFHVDKVTRAGTETAAPSTAGKATEAVDESDDYPSEAQSLSSLSSQPDITSSTDC